MMRDGGLYVQVLQCQAADKGAFSVTVTETLDLI